MALVLADRVKDTTTTTGTGAVTLSGTAPTGYQTFGAAIGNANTTYYTIAGGSQWEVGIGTYTAAGTSLSRDTVLSSSTGSKIDFAAGQKDVFVTYPSGKSVYQDAGGNVGIGYTPGAWDSGFAMLQAGSNGSAFGGRAASNSAYMISNGIRSGSAWKYIGTAAAAQFQIENGICYWYNAPSGTAGTSISYVQAMTLDASGNLGVGETPSSWGNVFRAMQIGGYGSYIAGRTAVSQVHIGANNYFNGTNWIYTNSAAASHYYQSAGSHIWEYAASGTAAATITWTTAMTLDASGFLLVGTTTSRCRATISGTSANSPTLGTATGSALFCNTDPAYGMMFGVSSSGYGWIQQQRVDGTGTAYDLTLQPSGGNVGIGANPTAGFALDVVAATARIRLNSSTGTNLAEHRIINTGGTQYFGLDSSGGSLTGVAYASYNWYSGNYPMIFATNNAERMRITATGNLQIGGTTTGASRLYIVGATADNTAYAILAYNSAPTTLFYVRNDGVMVTGTAAASPYNNTTATAANMVVDSSGTLLRSTSSLRYKNSVQDAVHGLSDLLKLRSVTYKGNNDGDTVFGGLIAEEVHAAGLTEFVAYDAEGRPDALNYGNMVALCIKSIQQLEARLAALEGTPA